MRYIIGEDSDRRSLFAEHCLHVGNQLYFLVCAVPQPSAELKVVTCVHDLTGVFNFDLSRQMSEMCYTDHTPTGRIDFSLLHMTQLFFAEAPALIVLGLDTHDPVFETKGTPFFGALSLKLGEALGASEQFSHVHSDWAECHRVLFNAR